MPLHQSRHRRSRSEEHLFVPGWVKHRAVELVCPPPIRQSETPGQQSPLIVFWQQAPPVCLKLQSWSCNKMHFYSILFEAHSVLKGYFLFCHWYCISAPFLYPLITTCMGQPFVFAFIQFNSDDLIVWDIIYFAIPFSPSALPKAFKAGWALCVFVFSIPLISARIRLLDGQTCELSPIPPCWFSCFIDWFIYLAVAQKSDYTHLILAHALDLEKRNWRTHASGF